MNPVKTFLTWRGCLPALGAAAWLAAFPGAALAQSIGFGFDPVSGSVSESATSTADTPPILITHLKARGLPPPGSSERQAQADMLRGGSAASNKIEIQNINTSRFTVMPENGTAGHKFDTKDVIELVISPVVAGDPDWKDNTYTLKVTTSAADIIPNPAGYTFTVVDDDVPPALEFTRERIRLTRGSRTSAQVRLVPGAPGASIPDEPDVGTVFVQQDLKIAVSDPDIVSTGGCAENPAAVLDIDTGAMSIVAGPDADGLLTADYVDDFELDPQTFTFEACAGAPGFRDAEITFTFDAKSLTAENGAVAAGNTLTVVVENDAVPPSVGFTSSNLLVEEGRANTVVVVASGPGGDDVGSVGVTVSGEAAVTLWQDGEQLEANADGSFTIDFGASASALLEIRAAEDGGLADGERKTATVAITDANGAALGDRKAITITVTGATAVPALPLAGQLLLAVLLAAGGARLRRRG